MSLFCENNSTFVVSTFANSTFANSTFASSYVGNDGTINSGTSICGIFHSDVFFVDSSLPKNNIDVPTVAAVATPAIVVFKVLFILF